MVLYISTSSDNLISLELTYLNCSHLIIFRFLSLLKSIFPTCVHLLATYLNHIKMDATAALEDR